VNDEAVLIKGWRPVQEIVRTLERVIVLRARLRKSRSHSSAANIWRHESLIPLHVGRQNAAGDPAHFKPFCQAGDAGNWPTDVRPQSGKGHNRASLDSNGTDSFRLKPMSDAVPSWCPFFSPEQYERFRTLLRAELAKHGLQHEIHLVEGYADLDFPGNLRDRVGLVGPAQKCNMRPEAEWARTLTEHFSSLDQTQSNLQLMRDFDSVRDAIRVRVYPDLFVDQPDATVLRFLAPGINVHPVVDMPDRVMVVLRRHLSDWGLSEDELFRLGTEQARRHETVGPELIDLGEGVSFHTIRGNSFLVSANALWLEEYIEPAGRGALVALPNRHEVLFHEIKSLGPLVRTHDALAKIVRDLFDEGPGSISPELYWWCDGRWTHLPLKFERGRLVHLLPREFVEEVIEPLQAAGR
jgi:hypothetical protein